MNSKCIVRVVALLPLFFTSMLVAQVPQMINYQGRVAVGGTSFSGVGQFNFSFINADGSQTYWQANGVAINVANGLFTVRLGDTALPNMTAISPDVFTDPSHGDVRLRVAFNDGTHGFQTVGPDTRMLAVPFAIAANTANFGFPAHAQEFKQPGMFNFTVPAGVTKILAEVWGAGGGGFSFTESSYPYNTTGGSGAYSRKVISVMPGEVLTVVIGEGGGYGLAGGLSKISKPQIPSGETILCFAEGGRPGQDSVTPRPAAQPDPSANVGRQGALGTLLGGAQLAPVGTVAPPTEWIPDPLPLGKTKYWCLGGAGSYSSGTEGYILLQW